MTNTMLEEFKLHFPVIWKRVVNYWTNDPYDLYVELDDGMVLIFDSIEKTIRRLPQDSNSMTEQECVKEFGTRLRKLIYRKGFTQEDLSKATGISQAALSYYITGKSSPSFSKVDKICKALDCSMDCLRYTTNK